MRDSTAPSLPRPLPSLRARLVASAAVLVWVLAGCAAHVLAAGSTPPSPRVLDAP